MRELEIIPRKYKTHPRIRYVLFHWSVGRMPSAPLTDKISKYVPIKYEACTIHITTIAIGPKISIPATISGVFVLVDIKTPQQSIIAIMLKIIIVIERCQYHRKLNELANASFGGVPVTDASATYNKAKISPNICVPFGV